MLNAKKLILFSLVLSFITFGQFFSIATFGTVTKTAQAASLWDKQSETAKIGKDVYGGEKPKYDVRVIVARVVKIFMSFLGLVMVVLLVLAGSKYMMAGGNDEKVTEALDQIKNASIGLVIVLSAWMIANYVTTCATDIMTAGPVWLCK